MNEDPNRDSDKRTPLDVSQSGLNVRLTQSKMSPWIWLLIATAVIVAVLLLTNPSQETHLKAIRDSGGYEDEYSIEYHYYFVFSTASTRYWGGRPKETLSYGFLGAVISTKHYTKVVP